LDIKTLGKQRAKENNSVTVTDFVALKVIGTKHKRNNLILRAYKSAIERKNYLRKTKGDKC